MISLILPILITYGIVLIAVRGTLFNVPRTAVLNTVSLLSNWFNPTKEHIIELLMNNSLEIDDKYKHLHQKIIQAGENDSGRVADTLDNLFNKIIAHVKIKRNTRILKKIFFYALSIINKLWSCPMCLGFWIGVFYCILTASFSISILGSSLTIVTCSGIPFIIGVFLCACLLSGTTWAIDQIVEYYSETKDKMNWQS